MRRPRRNHTAAFKTKVAITALKGDETLHGVSFPLIYDEVARRDQTKFALRLRRAAFRS